MWQFPLFMLCGQLLWYIASKPAIHKIIIFVFFPENCVGQTSWHKRFRKLFPTCLEKFLTQPASAAIFLLYWIDCSEIFDDSIFCPTIKTFQITSCKFASGWHIFCRHQECTFKYLYCLWQCVQVFIRRPTCPLIS